MKDKECNCDNCQCKEKAKALSKAKLLAKKKAKALDSGKVIEKQNSEKEALYKFAEGYNLGLRLHYEGLI